MWSSLSHLLHLGGCAGGIAGGAPEALAGDLKRPRFSNDPLAAELEDAMVSMLSGLWESLLPVDGSGGASLRVRFGAGGGGGMSGLELAV